MERKAVVLSRALASAIVLLFLALFCSAHVDAQVTPAQFVYPTNGATGVDGTRAFEWTPVTDAQAYFLYVGTSLGARDIHSSGEIQQTSRVVAGLPTSQTLYARIWTKIAGAWHFSDISFSTAASVLSASRFVYPLDGAAGVDSNFFQWTAVTGAQAYALYIGTAPGAANVHNSREIQTTSRAVPELMPNQTLYGRIWSKIDGVWYQETITFTTAAAIPATLTYPQHGTNGVDGSTPFQWTPVANAQAYVLYIGTSAGANDVHNSGQTQATSRAVGGLPANQTLHARLWTQLGGTWYSKDSVFTTGATAPAHATFTYPTNGASGVNGSVPFQWTAPANAQAYFLQVGRTPGANDVYNSGEIQETSRIVAGLPPNQTLYARIWSKIDGTWYNSAITFTSASTVLSQASFTHPLDGAPTIAGNVPFEWTPVSGAQAYFLYVGTSLGANNLHSSGEIQTTGRLATGLPSNQTLYARIWTKITGYWYYKDVAFTTTTVPSGSFADRLNTSLQRTAEVRAMADANNTPFPGTELHQVVVANGRTQALCDDYAVTLLNILRRDVMGAARILWISFNGNTAHTAVEFYNEAQNTWMILDPTFALSAKRSSDGAWATARDISNATLSQSWNAIAYQHLSGLSPGIAQGYYIDYPLLYLNLYHQGAAFFPHIGNSPLPYLELIAMPADGLFTFSYTMTKPGGGTASVVVDGQTKVFSFHGIDVTAPLFGGGAISLPAGSPAGMELYHVKRYVFELPKAQLTYPTDGATGVDGGTPFQWTAAAGAQGYTLWIGTTPGARDVHDSGAIQTTSRSVSGLPASRTLYARIWTKQRGAWYYNDISFTTAAVVVSDARAIAGAYPRG